MTSNASSSSADMVWIRIIPSSASRETKLFQVGDGSSEMLSLLISRHLNKQAQAGTRASRAIERGSGSARQLEFLGNDLEHDFV